MRWTASMMLCVIMLFVFLSAFLVNGRPADEGAFTYDDFDASGKCKMCHKEIYLEWKQSMMSQCFTHEWDEVEYFNLALPHALKLEKVAGVKAGCIGCHAPLAFLAGDIPPKRPAEGTRANEGVACDICHTITGSTEEEPFNFSYVVEPGKVKQGWRKEVTKSTFHRQTHSTFIHDPKLCACCHDEQSPYGAWVKSTYREWKAGPYAEEGVRCHDCHMHYAPGRAVASANLRQDLAHHNFHGAHFPGKLAGAVDLALYPSKDEISPGKNLSLTVNLFNGKAGHCVPTGSSEERMLWLEVTAVDGAGKAYSIPVTPKGFEGEVYTIADPDALAYQAMGEIMEIENFAGVSRDGKVPAGCRIFRRPFFDPKGRMTICQWYTAENEKVDYRIGPRQTVIERYTWKVPGDAAPGPMTVKAALFFAQVPSSVGEFLKLPESEYAPVPVNEVTVAVEIF